MKTKTITLYKLEELPKESQAKIIEMNRSINIHDMWHDGTLEDWKHQLAHMGFEQPDIAYTGFCSQGDGASFTCKSIDFVKILKHFKLNKRFTMLGSPARDGYLWSKVIRSNHCRYSHAQSVSLMDIEETYYTIAERPKAQTRFHDQLTELETFLKEEIETISNGIYHNLRDDHEALQLDENVRETIIANDYYFNADTLQIEQ